MAPRFSPRMAASAVVTVAVLGTLAVVYFTILAPQIKTRRKLQYDLEGVQSRAGTVQRRFGNNPDPEAELALLEREVDALQTAITSLAKISNARLPATVFPEDIDTPDVQQLLFRYGTFLDEAGEELEDRLRDKYREKRIPFSRDIRFKTKLPWARGARIKKHLVVDAANKIAVGLSGLEDVAQLFLDAEVFAVRGLRSQGSVRTENIWLLTYKIEVELSTQSLARLMYLMRDQEAYYYFTILGIEPVTDIRGNTYFSRKQSDLEDMDELRLTGSIRTIRNQAQAVSLEERREEAREASAVERAQQERRDNDPLAWMIQQLENPDGDKSVFGEEKPWWKFW